MGGCNYVALRITSDNGCRVTFGNQAHLQDLGAASSGLTFAILHKALDLTSRTAILINGDGFSDGDDLSVQGGGPVNIRFNSHHATTNATVVLAASARTTDWTEVKLPRLLVPI